MQLLPVCFLISKLNKITLNNIIITTDGVIIALTSLKTFSLQGFSFYWKSKPKYLQIKKKGAFTCSKLLYFQT